MLCSPALDMEIWGIPILMGYLVDLIGIEPMTSSMPWKRAPSCATGPLLGKDLPILADAREQVKRHKHRNQPLRLFVRYSPVHHAAF